jgi:hypothetical protein
MEIGGAALLRFLRRRRLHKHIVFWNGGCSRDRIVPDFDGCSDSAERCIRQFLLNILGTDRITSKLWHKIYRQRGSLDVGRDIDDFL